MEVGDAAQKILYTTAAVSGDDSTTSTRALEEGRDDVDCDDDGVDDCFDCFDCDGDDDEVDDNDDDCDDVLCTKFYAAWAVQNRLTAAPRRLSFFSRFRRQLRRGRDRSYSRYKDILAW